MNHEEEKQQILEKLRQTEQAQTKECSMAIATILEEYDRKLLCDVRIVGGKVHERVLVVPLQPGEKRPKLMNVQEISDNGKE